MSRIFTHKGICHEKPIHGNYIIQNPNKIAHPFFL